jgi:hypothetical protein
VSGSGVESDTLDSVTGRGNTTTNSITVGGLNDLTIPTGTGTIAKTSDIPTNNNQLTNGAGYITDYTVTQGDVTAHQAALSITESQISDLGTYLTTETNDLTSAVTWANVPDANITQSSVTQHQAAFSITESQITDHGTYATLVGGTVPASQLPSYVDDVEEYATYAGFPGTGETGKIYVDIATGDIYRWSGSQYVQINDAVSSADQATRLATPRTISLGGDVTGSASFDGTVNITITAAVADDSHNHIITNVDGLQSALDGKLASTSTTDNITEGSSNLYYTDARANSAFDTRIATKDTDDLSEGSTNLYYTNARFDTQLATKDTGDLSEGSNQYYTDARVLTKINITSIDALTDVDTTTAAPSDGQVLTWDNTNSYWKPSTVSGGGGGGSGDITSVVAGSGLTGGSSTGDATLNVGAGSFITVAADTVAVDATDANTASKVVARDASGDFSAGTITASLTGNVTGTVSDVSNHDTDDITEGSTNLYYTDARSNSAFDTRLATKSTSDLAEGTNLYYTNSRADGRITNAVGTSVQAYSSVLDATTASYTTAEETKLSGIEASADVTDTTNVVAALTAGTNVAIAANGTISSTDTDTVPNDTAITIQGGSANGITVTNGGFTLDQSSGQTVTIEADLTDLRTKIGNDTTSSIGQITVRPISSTSGQLRLQCEDSSADSHLFTLEGPAHSGFGGAYTWKVPGSQGTAGQGIKVNSLSGSTATLGYFDVPSDTGDIAEGTNLYHTTERVEDAVANQFVTVGQHTGISFSYDDANDGAIDATVSLGSFSTDNLTEGSTNLYFTNERVDDRVDALITDGTGVTSTYNDAAGTLTLAIGQDVATTSSVTFAGVSAPLTGNVTGSVTGDVTGNITSTGTSTFATADINGGAIDGTAIGANSASSVAATTLTTTGDVTIGGDLTVSGTTTTVNTETLEIADNQIVLNSNYSGSAPSENAGIEINRGGGTAPNKTLLWNESDDEWTVGSEKFVAGIFEGALTGNVTSAGTSAFTTVDINGGAIDGTAIGATTPSTIAGTAVSASSGFTGDLTGDVTGAVTGNVTGNITSSGTSAFSSIDVNGGSIDGATIGSATAATITGTTITANNGFTGNITSTGTSEFTTIDVNGGTIDNTTIGGASPAVITGTSITANTGFTGNLTGDVTGSVTVGSGKTLNVSAGTLTLADDQISGDKIEGGTIGSVAITTADINGGDIDGTVIGGTTPAAITGTTITDSKGDVRDIPSSSTTGTLAGADAGKFVSITANIAIPASTFSAGEAVTIYNNSTSEKDITSAVGVTAYLAGTDTTGTRQLAQRGLATLLCVGTNTFVISGVGLT